MCTISLSLSIHIYIYTYVYMYPDGLLVEFAREEGAHLGCGQNGVDTNGAAATVMNVDGFGKKVRP